MATPVLLQATKAYAPHLGGVETVVRQIGERAAATGWSSRALVAAEGRRAAHDLLEGVAVRRVPTLARMASLPLAPGYPVALAAARADVLLVHEPSLLAAAALRFGGARLRRRFGAIAVWWHSDVVRQRRLAVAYQPLFRHELEIADTVFVASPQMLDSSPALAEVAAKVRVVPYGIDPTRYVADDARRERVARLRAGWAAPTVLFVGRLSRYKGIPQLLAAMDHVPGARLVVVGAGPCHPQVVESAAYRRGQVLLLGPQPHEALVDLYRACDVFCLPSTQRSEAFGIVQVEAMACSRPLVSFDLPTGVTHVNRHDHNGLVVPLGDTAALGATLDRLFGDEPLRDRLGRCGRRRFEEEFTEARMLGEIFTELDRLVGG